ncbi:hypothetical protein DND58_20165 [Pseudomonas syringae pv. pisi]|uniref:Uncharacterized protein n=1 Tax=Pseudomonas syringae pv. pisi str. 1704B TaxID=629263 RepID=F3GAQ0_PSESJ|nr:hypothetical protein PSYPI_17862 [Pseudomonas syringae pv. pisi str. 1704B]PYD10403.1 hypothetical protein DND62_19310 [Pseudomonas syringae pv. pisi]PYD28229.1 hypothetical protein DND67_20735 [Pseudomonas syringae pv. pisi]PYD29758.1 hypothetical protein DND58_20165 [Pseudomonas syringae pv. pisi]
MRVQTHQIPLRNAKKHLALAASAFLRVRLIGSDNLLMIVFDALISWGNALMLVEWMAEE